MSTDNHSPPLESSLHNKTQTYVAIIIVSFLLLSIVVIGSSYLLNPFAIYTNGGQLSKGRSIDLFWHIRLHKPYRIEQVKAENLILGSSRSGRLAPELLTESGRSSYNASLPGGTLYEIQRQLEHANATQPVKSAVIGLDYFMFRDDRPKYLTGFSDARLRSPESNALSKITRAWQRLIDGWSTLYSRSAIAADITLLNDIKRENRRVFFLDGTWRAEPGELAGHWVYSMLVREKFFEFTTLSTQHDLQKLEKLLQFCQQHDIELILLLSPTHGYLMNAIELAGGWPRYLQYQRDVVSTVARYNTKDYTIKLYGFEQTLPMLYEAINADYQWYLDGIHYTPEAGREMMNCLMPHLNELCRKDFQPVLLNSDTIDRYLQRVSTIKQEYRSARASDYQRLQEQVENLRREDDNAAAAALRL